MELLNQDIRSATKKKFDDEMKDKVTILLFTQEPGILVVPWRVPGQECQFCGETRQLLTEVSSLSDKIELQVLDFVSQKDKAAVYGVDKIPAAVILGESDTRIRFFGVPSGYEYTSLVEAIVDASKRTTSLNSQTLTALKTLEKDVHIQIFVTPTCPHCTTAVRLGHQMALESARVRADMVESMEFPHLVQKYGVRGVPRTIMNETVTLDGATPEDVFLAHVLEAAGQTKT
jgi:glutaredoxin-like protein